MGSSGAVDPTRTCHVVAMPYPGRGHINPMLNFCKVLAGKARAHILITMVLTEEWLGFIGSDPKPDNLRLVSIPNVVPSELVRAADMIGFIEAVWTKMEAPFERLLDTGPPPGLIVADTFMGWAVRVGSRRNIPVASFWTMSSSMFSFFYHFGLLSRNGHFPVNLREKGEEVVDYLPGVSPTKIADLPQMMFSNKNPHIRQQLLEQFTLVSRAQYLLLPSVHELEPDAAVALAPVFPFPVFTVGPAIPYFNLHNSDDPQPQPEQDVFQFLDQQPNDSVLYISFGSHQSISTAQTDEIAAGLLIAGVRFLWVARGGDARRLREASDDMGLVVPWCDQLRVLSHSSVGGFLTHCGWSSVMEGLFAGVPYVTFPIISDQELNSKMIVEDWKVGLRMKKYGGGESLVNSREEVAELVQRVMGLESEEGREMRKRASDLQMLCRSAIAKEGSSETSIDSFIDSILD